MITFEHALDFVMANRQGKVFKDFTREQVYAEICASAKTNTFCFITDDEKLVGVITASPTTNEKEMRIHNVLCTRAGAFTAMVRELEYKFPGWTLVAKRHGRTVVYNTLRLCKKILH